MDGVLRSAGDGRGGGGERGGGGRGARLHGATYRWHSASGASCVPPGLNVPMGQAAHRGPPVPAGHARVTGLGEGDGCGEGLRGLGLTRATGTAGAIVDAAAARSAVSAPKHNQPEAQLYTQGTYILS